MLACRKFLFWLVSQHKLPNRFRNDLVNTETSLISLSSTVSHKSNLLKTRWELDFDVILADIFLML